MPADDAFANLELELKFRLTDAAQHARLRAALGAAHAPDADAGVEQRNHFFDTQEHALARAHYTLRLREQGGGYLLTVKGPERRSRDGLLTEKLEREGPLEASTARALLGGTLAPLDALEQLLGADGDVCRELRVIAGGQAMTRVGGFTNTRTALHAVVDAAGRRWPVVFELDRTRFHDGRVDFELEVELRGVRSEAERDALADAIRSLVQGAGVALVPASSKAQRMFEILRGAKKTS